MTVRRGFEHFGKVTGNAAHDGLRFRIAHAAVEFQSFCLAVFTDHEARIEEPGVGKAVLCHPFHGGFNDVAHHLGVNFRRDDGSRAVGAHAARVGAHVVIQKALMVLARRERQNVFAVHHDDETRFFAVEIVFDHDAGTGGTEFVAFEHIVHGAVRGFNIHRDDDALAGGKAVGLDDDRRAFFVKIGVSLLGIRERFVVRRRNAVALHEGLGEILGAFQLCGFLRGAEDGKTFAAEDVHKPLR